MEDLLKSAGLNEPQAHAYLFLLRKGESAPPAIADGLGLTRSNAYKVLDGLVDLGLAQKVEINKKFVYKPEDPIALINLVAEERKRVHSLEKSLQESMHELRSSYQKISGARDLQTYQGSQAVASLLEQYSSLENPPLAINSSVTEGYTAPVEWIIQGDELLVIQSSHEPTALRIKDKAVAEAFIELCQLINGSDKKDSGYKKLLKQAKRTK